MLEQARNNEKGIEVLEILNALSEGMLSNPKNDHYLDLLRTALDYWGNRRDVESSMVRRFWFSFDSEQDEHILLTEFQNGSFYIYYPREPQIESLYDAIEDGESIGRFMRIAIIGRVPWERVHDFKTVFARGDGKLV